METPSELYRENSDPYSGARPSFLISIGPCWQFSLATPEIEILTLSMCQCIHSLYPSKNFLLLSGFWCCLYPPVDCKDSCFDITGNEFGWKTEKHFNKILDTGLVMLVWLRIANRKQKCQLLFVGPLFTFPLLQLPILLNSWYYICNWTMPYLIEFNSLVCMPAT